MKLFLNFIEKFDSVICIVIGVILTAAGISGGGFLYSLWNSSIWFVGALILHRLHSINNYKSKE